MKENSILLAEFLGWEPLGNNKSRFKATQPYYITTEEIDFDFRNIVEVDVFETAFDDMKFSEDWNWLMLVVEKIFNTDEYYKGFIDYNSSIVSDGQIKLSYKIKDVYQQCIEFVKWYNKQT